MRKNYTHITLVLDRSGSMASVKTQMEDAINDYIASQKLLAKTEEQNQSDFLSDALKEKQLELPCTITYVVFDSPNSQSDINFVFEGRDLYSINERLLLEPRGGTPLYDAIGLTIQRTGEYLSNMKEEDRPEKVIMAIVTDGAENQSKTFTQEQVAEMLKHQEQVYKWTFLFLGTNQDAVLTAVSLNIKAGNAISYTNNSKGIASASHSLNKYSLRVREMDMSGYVNAVQDVYSEAFTSEDRAEQEEAKK